MNYDLTITKKISYTTKDLEDILCSCIEGGCSYWAMIGNDTEEYKKAKKELHQINKDHITIEECIIHMWENGDDLVIWEDEEDDGSFSKMHNISLNDFLKGIRAAIEDETWDGDIYNCDGCVGDTIMQYACFDEIIYG